MGILLTVLSLSPGGGEHVGGRPEVHLNFDNLPTRRTFEAVGLQTPPRTLTLEEQFPLLDSNDDEEVSRINEDARIPNG